MSVVQTVGRGYLQRNSKTVTFTGAAGLGAVGAVPLFTVTGRVLVTYITAFCSSTLTEAAPTATIALGTATAANNGAFIAATTATNITTNDIWIDTSPDEQGVVVAIPSTMIDNIVTENIQATVAAQAVNGGVLSVDVYWLPLSSDGLIA